LNSFGQNPAVGAFPIFHDSRGALGVAEFGGLPFMPQRIFWIFEVAEAETRANHGHRVCEQLVFVQQGSVRGFTLDAEQTRFDFALTCGDWLYVPVRHWLQISDGESPI
jgi:WxcM-like, C-terminal